MGHGLRDKRLYPELEGREERRVRAGPGVWGGAPSVETQQEGSRQAPAEEGNGSRHGQGRAGFVVVRLGLGGGAPDGTEGACVSDGRREMRVGAKKEGTEGERGLQDAGRGVLKVK